jgi:translocator protein
MPSVFRDAIDDIANSDGRSPGHIALGAALCMGALLGSAIIAVSLSPVPERDIDPEETSPQAKPLFSAVWAPLFLILTLSGWRVWNAPRTPERTEAMGRWFWVQGLNAVLTAWAPQRREISLLTSLLTLGAVRAYADSLRKVDDQAAGMVAPFASLVSLGHLAADFLSEVTPGRDPVPEPATVH